MCVIIGDLAKPSPNTLLGRIANNNISHALHLKTNKNNLFWPPLLHVNTRSVLENRLLQVMDLVSPTHDQPDGRAGGSVGGRAAQVVWVSSLL